MGFRIGAVDALPVVPDLGERIDCVDNVDAHDEHLREDLGIWDAERRLRSPHH